MLLPPARFGSRRPARLRAFTLLEILVVLAIIGLLVGLAVGNLGNFLGGGQEKTAKIFVQSSIKLPLTAYRIDMGDYPSTAEGLQALVTAPAGKEGKWTKAYLDVPGNKIPTDPWGEAYIYRYPGTQNKSGYDVVSKGPDRTEGTADDIGNW